MKSLLDLFKPAFRSQITTYAGALIIIMELVPYLITVACTFPGLECNWDYQAWIEQYHQWKRSVQVLLVAAGLIAARDANKNDKDSGVDH